MKEKEKAQTEEKKQRILPKISISHTSSDSICIVDALLEAKIRWLCEKLPKQEWSGVLLYECKEGDSGKLFIRAKDVYLMDIGSSTYTEFESNFDVMKYQLDNGLMDCYTGLIHSHNCFSTFFSGQDIHTLEDNAIDMNRFFSLIVNNQGTYKAAITKKCKVTESGKRVSVYNSFEDKEIIQQTSFETGADNVYDAEYVEIKVESPKASKKDLDFLEEQFKELERQAAKRLIAKPKVTTAEIPFTFNESTEKRHFPTKEEPKATNYEGNLNKFATHMGNILLTGILSLDIDSPINIDRWVKERMDLTFRKRFGNPDSKAFENYVETILCYIEGEFDEFMEEDGIQLSIDFIGDEEEMLDNDISRMYAALYNYLCLMNEDSMWIDKILYELYNMGYLMPMLEQQMYDDDYYGINYMKDGRKTK